MMRTITTMAWVGPILSCLLVGNLEATVVPRYAFDELIRQSSRIVHVRCLGTDTYLESETGTIWTRNYFEILDTLKGNVTTRIVVTEPGGVIGNQGQWVPGAPNFSTGDESVLFLSSTVRGKWRVFGWGQGNYRVHHDARTGHSTVKPDLGGIQLASPTGSISREGSQSRESQLPNIMSLEELKSQVRKRIGDQQPR